MLDALITCVQDRQRQAETGRDRQRQAETGRDRQRQAEIGQKVETSD